MGKPRVIIRGISVSLSSDGSRVAIGASSNDGGAVDPPGHARIYRLSNGSTWTQVRCRH